MAEIEHDSMLLEYGRNSKIMCKYAILSCTLDI